MADANESLDLIGTSIEFHSEGPDKRVESITTEEFNLSQGVLIAYFEHEGSGPFQVSCNRTDTGFLGGLLDLPDFFEGEGTTRELGGWLVKDGWASDLKPGTYELEIEATGNWLCELFQPDLGQAAPEFPVRYSGFIGDVIAGTFRVGSRPLLANLRHDGAGEFAVKLLSLDGTDEREKVEEGQIHLEDYLTSAQPGKEYLVLVRASGDWELEFTEGY